jgi:ABC-type uncharacterized transport system permease subunit
LKAREQVLKKESSFVRSTLSPVMERAAHYIAVLVFAFGLNAIMLLIAQENVGEAYRTFFYGAFGDLWNFSRTLRWATPLIFTGLSVSVAFRAGIFNVGAEGQVYIGAFAATWVAITLTSLPKVVIVPLAFLAGGLAGALWASIAGWMKVRYGANEVVITLMMNYIATLFTEYLVRYPFYTPGTAGESVSTVAIAPQAELITMIPGTHVTTGLIYGLIAAYAVYYWNKKTVSGYELKILGTNPRFAQFGGIDVPRRQMQVMALSGALAGLAGAVEILGVQRRFITRFAVGLGFDGVTVALLAQNNPLGVPFGALFMGAIKSGGLALEMFSNVPRAMVTALVGIIILTVTIQGGLRLFRRRGR